MAKQLIRVALYTRVSSDEQVEKGDSIRDQQERGKKYIDSHDNMILQDIYTDDSDKIGLNQQSPYSKGGALI